jgi:hypothetical protein
MCSSTEVQTLTPVLQYKSTKSDTCFAQKLAPQANVLGFGSLYLVQKYTISCFTADPPLGFGSLYLVQKYTITCFTLPVQKYTITCFTADTRGAALCFTGLFAEKLELDSLDSLD